MTLAERVAPVLMGHAKPRLAPPFPARSAVADFQASAEEIGLKLIPAQVTVGHYLYALNADDLWLYPEVAAIESRQNGKTEILLPHICRRLKMGRRILHAAQTRERPRDLFKRLAPIIERTHRDAIVRRGAGQESIELANGGLYVITAATGGGARGISGIDDLLLDEVRELDDDFIAAAEPTTSASPNPQIFYLSNAGHESSYVLNAIRERADTDPALAYLEWSADPKRDASDHEGWAEANPALGYFKTLETMERFYTSSRLSRSMARFETEHLCRWVNTLREPLVDITKWNSGEVDNLQAAKRSFMAVSMDPAGARAAAAIAWQEDDHIALRLLFDVTGDPINPDKLGKEIRDKAREIGVAMTGFDPLTDAQLARYLPRAEPIAGQKYANASARFVERVEGGKLQWTDCAGVGADLTYTARKPHDESGSFQAVRADDERPITAVLAAIRAVWLASEMPRLVGKRQKAVGF